MNQLIDRKCTKCNIVKVITQFHRKGKGYRYVCKECRKIETREYCNRPKVINFDYQKCVDCNEEKHISQYYKDPKAKTGLEKRCKQCHKKKGRDYWNFTRRDRIKIISEDCKKVCNNCGVEKYYLEFFKNSHCNDGYNNICKQCYSIQNKMLWFNRKIKILKLISGINKTEELICSCCDEKEVYALDVDHINNNGNDERKIYGKGTRKYYGLILSGKISIDNLQILCRNCNWIKWVNGGLIPTERYEFFQERRACHAKNIFDYF